MPASCFLGSPAQFIASPKFFRNSFDVRICPATVSALREKGLAKASKLEKRFSNFRLRRCKWSLRLPARVLRVLLRKSRNFCKNRVDQGKRKVRLNFSVESGGSLEGEWCSSSF